MSENNENELLLKAYHNGRKIIRPFLEMWRLFWSCQYAWLLPLDWYRWSFGGGENKQYVFQVMSPGPRHFGLCLHLRGNLALTLSDYEALLGGLDPVSEEGFQKLASRFSVLFGKGSVTERYRPFLHYRYRAVKRRSEPAYRMHPDRDRLLILGPAVDAGVPATITHGPGIASGPATAVSAVGGLRHTDGVGVIETSIDWELFLQPPPDASGVKRKGTRV